MDKINYGLDLHQLYEAHKFDLEQKAIMDRDIRETWREKYGWVPPSERRAHGSRLVATTATSGGKA